MMAKFKKKPVVIEAHQWHENGDHPGDWAPITRALGDGPVSTEFQRANDWEGQVVRRFRRAPIPGHRQCDQCGSVMHFHGWIDTLEGGHIVCPGDWVITGVKGEFYPCKPDIFAETYEPA